jgi:truncated hemoglobin YjbI
MSDPVLSPDAAARAEAMRRARPVEPVAQPGLWQRFLEYLRAAEGGPRQQAGQNVDRAIHDKVLPAPLQINEALATEQRKRAMIDAALKGSE